MATKIKPLIHKPNKNTTMKKVNIRGFLSESCKIKRYIDADGLREREFTSLKKLKEYYGLIDVKKTDQTEWAISSRGTQYDWFIYTALMPETNFQNQ